MVAVFNLRVTYIWNCVIGKQEQQDHKARPT